MHLATAAQKPSICAGLWLGGALAMLMGTGPVLAAAPVPPALPLIPQQAATADGFVPTGWVIEQRLSTDLNRDGRRDAVLLLRTAPQATPASAPAPASTHSPERALVVLLQQRSGWALAGANARLVPQLDLATQEDPLDNGELAAARGGFSLSLGLTSSAGSYLSAVLRWRFRVEPGCVRLIGYDRMQTHRATLDTQDLSINLLTGAVLRTIGNAQTDTSTRHRERLASNPRRCLPDLDDALSFQPLAAPR